MKSAINLLKDHLQARCLIQKEEVACLINNEPSCVYSGEAYRVILSSAPFISKPAVHDDVCFSKSLSGVRHYLLMQDLEYYKYIIVFKVIVTQGVEIVKLAESLAEENLHDILADLIKEEEILVQSIQSEEIIFEGKSDEYL